MGARRILHRESRQQRIAVLALVPHPRGAQHRRITRCIAEKGDDIRAGRMQADFLDGDDVGRKLRQHRGDPLGREASIGADAVMNVVGCDPC